MGRADVGHHSPRGSEGRKQSLSQVTGRQGCCSPAKQVSCPSLDEETEARQGKGAY